MSGRENQIWNKGWRTENKVICTEIYENRGKKPAYVIISVYEGETGILLWRLSENWKM